MGKEEEFDFIILLLYVCVNEFVNGMLCIVIIQFSFSYKLNAKNLATHFLSIFFWIKIDDFKNQCSIIFMRVQKTINVCRKSCIVTFG